MRYRRWIALAGAAVLTFLTASAPAEELTAGDGLPVQEAADGTEDETRAEELLQDRFLEEEILSSQETEAAEEKALWAS